MSRDDIIWSENLPSSTGLARKCDAAGETPLNGHAKQGSEDDARPDMASVRRNQVRVQPFPVDVLGPAADWVRKTAESKAAPSDYVALGLMITAAAVIGPKRRVSPWESWDEPSILWGALVGPPSVSKSPATDPFREIGRAS